MSHVERCPHCLIPPMRPYTNGFGGVFLSCLDCGYSESVRRRAVVEVETRKGLWPSTTREGLSLMRKEARRLGRPPKVMELGTRTPTQGWLRNKFGSIRGGYEAAGLQLPPRGNRTGRNGAELRRAVLRSAATPKNAPPSSRSTAA